jgi:hypothetical protein
MKVLLFVVSLYSLDHLSRSTGQAEEGNPVSTPPIQLASRFITKAVRPRKSATTR